MLDGGARSELFLFYWCCWCHGSGSSWQWRNRLRRAPGEKLLDRIHRVISLPSIKVLLGGFADQVPLGVQIDMSLVPADVFDQRRGNFFEEPRTNRRFGLSRAKPPPIARPAQIEFLARACHSDVAEPAFFLHLQHVARVNRPAVRKQAFFHSRDEYHWEL